MAATKRPKDVSYGSVVEIDKRGLKYYQWSVRRKGYKARGGQKAYANDAWDAVRAVLKEQREGVSEEAQTFTLKQWIDECVYKAENHVTRSGEKISLVTLDGYRRALETWVVTDIGTLRLSQLTREIVAGRKAGSIARKLADAARRGEIGKSTMTSVQYALGWVLYWAIYKGHLPMDCNYADKMFMTADFPRKVKHAEDEKKNYTSDETWKALVKQSGDHWIADCLRGGALSGARASEIFGIKWTDLNLEKRIWKPKNTIARVNKKLAKIAGVSAVSSQPLKTKQSGKAVGMTDTEIAFYQRLKEKAKSRGTIFSEYVFCQENGKPIDICLAAKAVRQFRGKLTNEDGTPVTYRSASRRFMATYGSDDIYTVLRDDKTTVDKHYRGDLDEELVKKVEELAKVQRAAKESLHKRIVGA